MKSRVFNAAAAVATQYTTRAHVPNHSTVGFNVQHPGGGTSTTYTVEASDDQGPAIRRGAETYSTYTGFTPVLKSSAENFTITLPDFPNRLVRLKMVTTVAGGTIVVDVSSK